MSLVVLESISVKIVWILGYSYGTTGVGGEGGSVPQSTLASLDLRMHEDYAFECVSVEFLCLSVCLSVCLAI